MNEASGNHPCNDHAIIRNMADKTFSATSPADGGVANTRIAKQVPGLARASGSMTHTDIRIPANAQWVAVVKPADSISSINHSSAAAYGDCRHQKKRGLQEWLWGWFADRPARQYQCPLQAGSANAGVVWRNTR